MRNLSLDPRAESMEATQIRPAPSFNNPASPPAFGSSAPSSSNTPAPKLAAAHVAVLGPTLRFKGELSAEEDFILQGKLEGSIHHTQSVTIGTDGSVVGNIHARVITVDGSVEGDLHATQSVVVHETGKLVGNIFAPRVGIVEGAYFSGRVEMVDARASNSAHTPVAKQLPETAPGVPLTAEETERMLSNQ